MGAAEAVKCSIWDCLTFYLGIKKLPPFFNLYTSITMSRFMYTHTHMYMYMCIYIYIYIYPKYRYFKIKILITSLTVKQNAIKFFLDFSMWFITFPPRNRLLRDNILRWYSTKCGSVICLLIFFIVAQRIFLLFLKLSLLL